ncbi:MAG: hypothetical protein ACRCSI_05580, partial [Eubacterium aggregans]
LLTFLVLVVLVGAGMVCSAQRVAVLPELFRGLSQEDKETQLTALEKMTRYEQERYLEISALEPAVTKNIKQITEDAGGENAGLEYRLKSPSSIYEKMYDREEMVDIDEIKDIIRYTEIFSADTLAQGTADSLKAYEALGYTIIKVKNTFVDENASYKGINTAMEMPNGQVFEIQFHTPASYEVKEESHKLYEEYRLLSPEDPKSIAIEDEMNAKNVKIGTIKNIESITNLSSDQ